MFLASSIRRIINRDRTLTKLIITPSCLAACETYEPHNSYYIDNIDADINSINHDIYNLSNEESGSREWFNILGTMIAELSNLYQLTFDGVDPDACHMDEFWDQLSCSKSLDFMLFANMNLESYEEILGGTINAERLATIEFNNCTIPHDIGCFMHDVLTHDSLTTIKFVRCCLSNTNSMREIIEFASYLATLKSVTSLMFIDCSLDHLQIMCLKRSLQEERTFLGLELAHLHIVHNGDACDVNK